ncbi:MAG: hypothetical protein R3B13_31120 [Polyangiaceae bacterium]
MVAAALVNALLGRADALLARLPAAAGPSMAGGSEDTAQELIRIHAFITRDVANAGSPAPDGHDSSTGIRDDALTAAARDYEKHLARHASWAAMNAPVHGSWQLVRAQLALAFTSLARGILPRHEVAKALGLDGPRRGLFERHGLIYEDGGSSKSEPRELCLRWLDSAPHAAADVDLILVSKSATRGLVSLRRIWRVGANASASAKRTGLWAEDVQPVAVDATSAELAFEIGLSAVRAAFAARAGLRTKASAVTERLTRTSDGALAASLITSMLLPEGSAASSRGTSPELMFASAAQLALLDFPRVASLALSRSAHGDDEGVAQLMITLTALAPTAEAKQKLWLGESAPDGQVRPLEVSVELDGDVVEQASYGKTKLRAKVSGDGQASGALLDGKAPTLPRLPLARLVPRAGESWSFGKQALERLSGAPLGLVVGDGRFVLAAKDEPTGWHALAFGAESQDASISAEVSPSGSGGALLLRAQRGSVGYDAIALFIAAEPKVAQLMVVDGSGKTRELTGPLALPSKESRFAARLEVKGAEVHATLGALALDGKLERAVGTGRPGLAVRAGGRLEIRNLSVKLRGR